MKAIDPKEVGGRVKALREKCGFSNQTDFAVRQLGIKQPSLSDIENGVTKEISGPVLARFCIATRTTAEYVMLGGTNDQDHPDLAKVIAEATFLLRNTSDEDREAAMRSLRSLARIASPTNGGGSVSTSAAFTDTRSKLPDKPMTQPLGEVTEGTQPPGSLHDTRPGDSFPSPAPIAPAPSGGRRKGDSGRPDGKS